MGKTSIEWCDVSWPIVNGCARISPGCGGAAGVGGCYAERLAATRLRRLPQYEGLATFGENGPRWTRKSRLWEPYLDHPLRLRTPSRIFVADMGDLFYEEVSNEEIAAVFGVMAAAPHTFQVLTKRTTRALEWSAWLSRYAEGSTTEVGVCLHYAQKLCAHPKLRDTQPILRQPWPLPNVWIGASVEDALRLSRIPNLLQIPAALHFVSVEPQLEDVDLSPFMPAWICACGAFMRGRGDAGVASDEGEAAPMCSTCSSMQVRAVGIDWVIQGGESGPGARRFDLAWARSLRDQCARADVPYFLKQLGSNPTDGMWTLRGHDHPTEPSHLRLTAKKGGDMAEWPEDLRVRQWPKEEGTCS